MTGALYLPRTDVDYSRCQRCGSIWLVWQRAGDATEFGCIICGSRHYVDAGGVIVPVHDMSDNPLLVPSLRCGTVGGLRVQRPQDVRPVPGEAEVE